MITVCFICSGNICRSPTAASILRQLVIEHALNDVTITSMGTLDIGPQPYDGVMSRIALNFGYQMTGTSTFMTKNVLIEADLILVMTYDQMMEIRNVLPQHRWKTVKLFNQFCFGKEVPILDPSYMSETVYLQTFLWLEKGCKVIIQKLKNNSLE